MRLAAIVIASAAFMGSAHAADIAVAPAPAADCNCGNGMIVVYDFQPGVVTRNWKDCDCRHEPAPRYRPVSGLPAYAPQFPIMNEPWRRY